MKTLIAILVLLLSAVAFAQSEKPASITITISSKGLDVREVLHDMFGQAKLNYVVENMQRQALFLSLDKMEFEEALQIVCKLSDLTYEVQNGVYFINKIAPPIKPPVKTVEAPKGKLPITALDKRVTTRMSKAEIAKVFAELSRQTNLKIELASGIPAYKLDAFLIGTTLKYALETITKAAGLEFVLTENMSILIQKPETNRVAIVRDGG